MDGDLLPLLFLRAQIEGAVNAAAEHTLQIDVIARRWLRFLWMRFDACTPPRYSPTFTRVILLTVLHVSLHTVALITYSNGAIIAWRRSVLFEISLWALVNRRETKDVVGSHSTNKLIYKQEGNIYISNTLLFIRKRLVNFYLWTHPKSIVSKEEGKLWEEQSIFLQTCRDFLWISSNLFPTSYISCRISYFFLRWKFKLLVNS